MAESSRSDAAPQDEPGEESFEAALQRLEQVVAQLEKGELELEDALGVFEEGVAVARRCAARLEGAERRIEELVRDGQDWIAKPLTPPEDT